MADAGGEVCSVCSRPGAKRCARCHSQFYCSKECQRKDWKAHKPVYNEVVKAAEIRKATMQPAIDANDAERDDYSNMLTFAQRRGGGPFVPVPMYHEEYRALYPSERRNFAKLHETWMMSASQPTELSGTHARYMVDHGRDHSQQEDLLKRWQIFGPELVSFLKSDPKPGDIFTNKVKVPYGEVRTSTMSFQMKLYQNMRNTPVSCARFQVGKTYVGVGYVDLMQLVVGSFEPQAEGEEPQPLKFVGIDKSELVVARSTIVYEMMKQGFPVQSILQVWFSTGWSEKALNDFSGGLY